MESTMDDKTVKGSGESLEQDTEKENESGDKSQANVTETENKNLGEAVGEVTSAEEHHDSSCPMVAEDSNSLASQSASVTIETETKEDMKENDNKDTKATIGEIALVGKHHGSPSPMVVEDGTSSASQSVSVAIETGTKEDVKEIDNKNPGETAGEVASAGEHCGSPSPIVVEDGTSFVSQSASVAIETGTKENVKENDNKDTEETVGEVASVEEHHDSPCAMVVEDHTPFASQSDSVSIETGTMEDVKENENKNPGKAVEEGASVGGHHGSPCPMVVEDETPSDSCIDRVSIRTGIKDDGSPKMDNETALIDKNTELESCPRLHPSPSAALDPDKGLVNPTIEALVEQTEASSQVSSDISKDEVDSAEVDGDTPAVQNNTAAKPDLKPTKEDVKEPVETVPKMIMEVDKASEEPDSKSLGDHINDPVMPDSKPTEEDYKEPVELDATLVMEVDKGSEEPDSKALIDNTRDPVIPDTKTMNENDNKIGEADTVNSAYHAKGLVNQHQESTAVYGNGPDVHGSETVSNHGSEPSKPNMETSTNSEKGPDLPVRDTLMIIDKKPDVLAAGTSEDCEKDLSGVPATQNSFDHGKETATLETEPRKDFKDEIPDSNVVADASVESIVTVEPAIDVGKKEHSEAPQEKDSDIVDASMKHDNSEPVIPGVTSSVVHSEEGGQGDLNNGVHKIDSAPPTSDGTMNSKHSFLLDDMSEGNESGTEEEQSAFMKELENFFRERSMEFKPPKFYGQELNCLKLWRSVTRLGGYDKVTACKLWRQVGESFRPPKTCTTVSWTFRGFYEKALLEYERHKVNGGELQIPLASNIEPMNIDHHQASGSGRARRDAAARAMQGWHSQRLLGNGEVSDPIIKDKNSVPQQKREKQMGTPGLLKRKRPVSTEHSAKSAHTQVSKPLLDVTVVDVGPPADWVKINVQRTKDCFEVYALVPGLLREEVRVQSDPAGRLVISGEPENPDNLWGATPFKKVVSLPARIDPHHTSAVVTLNGQLFVRVPLEQSE